MLDAAPESILPLLRNPKSAFYAWLDKVENSKDMGDEIKNIPLALQGGMKRIYDGLFLPWFDLLTTGMRGYSTSPDIDALIKALHADDELAAEAS